MLFVYKYKQDIISERETDINKANITSKSKTNNNVHAAVKISSQHVCRLWHGILSFELRKPTYIPEKAVNIYK